MLRERFDDTLLALIGAADKRALAANGDQTLGLLKDLLAFEIGDDNDDPITEILYRAKSLKADDPALSDHAALALALRGRKNKTAMKYMRDKVDGGPRFLAPEKGPFAFPQVDGIRVFALGPPRDPDLLLSLDPRAHEEFHLGFGLDGASRYLFGALSRDPNPSDAPFAKRHAMGFDDLKAGGAAESSVYEFYATHYPLADETAMTDMNAWRRIDDAWLGGSDALALRLNNEVNNTSLVIAIELPATGKVLLFTGDAQRGNWYSWKDLS